jgi:hypothetical protein
MSIGELAVRHGALRAAHRAGATNSAICREHGEKTKGGFSRGDSPRFIRTLAYEFFGDGSRDMAEPMCRPQPAPPSSAAPTIVIIGAM